MWHWNHHHTWVYDNAMGYDPYDIPVNECMVMGVTSSNNIVCDWVLQSSNARGETEEDSVPLATELEQIVKSSKERMVRPKSSCVFWVCCRFYFCVLQVLRWMMHACALFSYFIAFNLSSLLSLYSFESLPSSSTDHLCLCVWYV